MTVPAVPDAESVKPDGALQRRQSREQHHLDERKVGGKQAGNPPDAREELPRRARPQVAAMDPEPDDHPAFASTIAYTTAAAACRLSAEDRLPTAGERLKGTTWSIRSTLRTAAWNRLRNG